MAQPLIEEILSGENNYLLHGPGGTGKSYLIRELAQVARARGISVAKTATTGVSAIGIGGTTINRFVCIGVGDKPPAYYVAMIKKSFSLEEIKGTKLLVIDEISMMGKATFELLNEVLQRVLQCNKPMGGLRVLLSGDFCQLPPVKDQWIFLSEVWWELDLKPIKMEDPKRFTDVSYFNLLLRARLGEITSADVKLLESRVIGANDAKKLLTESSEEPGVMPTILYAKRFDVDQYNKERLDALDSPAKTYEAKDTFEGKNLDENYYKTLLDNIIPREVVLKIGAQVMLRANVDIGLSLVNGTRGVVVAMESSEVNIMLESGNIHTIEPHTWEVEDARGKATRKQIPLILAWALTVHKTQGSTIDRVICDVDENLFAYGQAYVLLSRVRSAEGLFLRTFKESSIRADPLVPKFLEEMDLI